VCNTVSFLYVLDALSLLLQVGRAQNTDTGLQWFVRHAVGMQWWKKTVIPS
jgi:hypothetical protein